MMNVVPGRFDSSAVAVSTAMVPAWRATMP